MEGAACEVRGMRECGYEECWWQPVSDWWPGGQDDLWINLVDFLDRPPLFSSRLFPGFSQYHRVQSAHEVRDFLLQSRELSVDWNQ